MKAKKATAALLAVGMTLTMLAGCGQNNSGSSDGTAAGGSGTQQAGDTKPAAESASAEAETKDPYDGTGPITLEEGKELTILAQTSNYANVDITAAPIVKKVVEDAGISVDWQLIDFNSYAESVSPMLASGNVEADIVLLPDNDLNQTYIKSGLFVPLNQYFDIMPNYSGWLDEHPDTKAAMTAEDGNIYYIPKTDEGYNYRPNLMYNQVWLDKANMEAPDTLDGFVEMLRYFRDHDMNDNGDTTDEIPLSLMAYFVPSTFGPAFGLELEGGFQADENGNVTYGYADAEKYKKYLEFVHSLYEEGLLEQEYLSLDRDQVVERIANDKTGATFDFSWSMSMMFSNVLPYYDGTADTAFVGVAPLSGEYEGFYLGGKGYSNMYGVSSKSDDIELAVKFLDFAYSDANQEMYNWGIEGESYTVDDQGNKVYTEKASDNDWLQQLGINPTFVLPCNTSKVSTDALLPEWHVEIDEWQEQFIRDPWPYIYSTEEESDILNSYLADIQTYASENQTAFITGTKSLDEFDDYIAGFDSLHLDDVLAVKQQQYTRYYNNLNQ